MRSAVQLVATGATDERAVDHDAEPCAICGGESTRGVPLAEFIGPTMTDQTSFRSPESMHACVCCAFVRARYSPVPGKPPAPGKKEGPRWSNFSHLYDDGRHTVASKGEKPAILAFLRGPKRGAWFAAIADSARAAGTASRSGPAHDPHAKSPARPGTDRGAGRPRDRGGEAL